MMTPVFEELSNEMKNIKFAKLNIEKSPEIAANFEVRGIPTLIIFNKGKEVDRITGFMQKQQLKKRVDDILKK
jgi:thioredoxin-like negative regulator of GroEL